MKIWTVVNQKGGVGKTTTAISAAGCLVDQGFKVVLIDLDPQASLSAYLGVEDEHKNSLYDYFLAPKDYSIGKLVSKTNLKNLDLIASTSALSTLDKKFGAAQGKGLIVKNLTKQLMRSYDYVIIDCPPGLGVLMVNGLIAADLILLPTQTEHLAKKGLEKMMDTLSLLSPMFVKAPLIKVVATMFDRRLKACQKAYLEMKAEYEDKLWRGYIPSDTKFREASEQGKPISAVSPNSRGHFAYEKLVNNLIYLSSK